MRAALACLLLATTAISTVGHAQQAPAQQRSGELTASAPRASFDVDLQAGQVVTLTAGGEVDTILTLYGPDGREITENDDVVPGDLSSRIIYSAERAGRYRAEVRGYGDATGTFTFGMRDGVDYDLSWQARTLSERSVSLSRRQPEVRIPVDLTGGEIFVATTFALAEDMDTTLSLENAAGEAVAESDDRGDGTLNSQVAFQPSEDGRYTLVVSSYNQASTGDLMLSLSIDPNAYVPFDFSTIARTEFDNQSGEITTDNPEPTFSYPLQAGQTVLFTAEAQSEELDTVLRLNGPDGRPVALNDDRGDGTLNSAIAYTAPTSGTYQLEVSGYGSSVGVFSLEASTVDASVVDTLRTVFEGRVILSGPEQIIETQDFRLRYTTEGDDATTQAFAQLTADTLQAAYTTQVTGLGWAPPVRDTDGRYRSYVAQAEDAMGYAKPLEMLFDNPGTPDVREHIVARGMLVIDNDLGNGRDEAPEALMHATVVHEFNHLVQYGYDAEEELNWLYESTASWIETATAGEDEDASRYSETDFDAPQLCWTTSEPGHDYGQWTLLQSLADSYGPRIVVRLWENAVDHDGMEVMSTTLAEVGTTTPDALRNWRIQNFARNYALAPRMTWSVARGGQIKRNGLFNGGVAIEQLGASYLQVRAAGPHRYALRDGDNMEMVGLGYRDGQVEITPLGRDGVFDGAGYERATIMVFNRNVPDRPGDCEGEAYSIDVSDATGAVTPVQSRMNAPHFTVPEA